MPPFMAMQHPFVEALTLAIAGHVRRYLQLPPRAGVPPLMHAAICGRNAALYGGTAHAYGGNAGVYGGSAGRYSEVACRSSRRSDT
eukprot:2548328-Rhodomonas_salina.1